MKWGMGGIFASKFTQVVTMNMEQSQKNKKTNPVFVTASLPLLLLTLLFVPLSGSSALLLCSVFRPKWQLHKNRPEKLMP